MSTGTLGVIIGNRDFFPDQLVAEARRDLLALSQRLDIELVLLDEHATKLGAVETWGHAKLCAELFRRIEIGSRVCSCRCPTSATRRGSPTR